MANPTTVPSIPERIDALNARMDTLQTRLDALTPEAVSTAINALLREQAAQLEWLVKLMGRARDMFASLAPDVAPVERVVADAMPSLAGLTSAASGAPSVPSNGPPGGMAEFGAMLKQMLGTP